MEESPQIKSALDFISFCTLGDEVSRRSEKYQVSTWEAVGAASEQVWIPNDPAAHPDVNRVARALGAVQEVRAT
jgi:hypothetical protein